MDLNTNILYSPSITSDYYKNFLDTISRYRDLSTTALYCRYYNINPSFIDGDIRDSRFKNGIVYDRYDYTPLTMVAQTMDSHSWENDKIGLRFTTSFDINLYTIKTPRQNDLLWFNKIDNNNQLIYKVDLISTSLSSQNDGVICHKVTLVYAPLLLDSIDTLNIDNKYVYYVPEQQNIPINRYVAICNRVELLGNIFSNLMFNERYELYHVEDITSLRINKLIYDFLALQNNYRLFPLVKIPYGIKKFNNYNQDFNLVNKFIIAENVFNYSGDFTDEMTNEMFYNLDRILWLP